MEEPWRLCCGAADDRACLSVVQINWFKHGSALNAMAALFKSQKKATA
jgi:hypothetical protein